MDYVPNSPQNHESAFYRGVESRVLAKSGLSPIKNEYNSPEKKAVALARLKSFYLSHRNSRMRVTARNCLKILIEVGRDKDFVGSSAMMLYEHDKLKDDIDETIYVRLCRIYEYEPDDPEMKSIANDLKQVLMARRKEIIPRLMQESLEALEKQGVDPLDKKAHILFLEEFSGKRFGDDTAKWREWLATNTR
jgi:hypothetical protein